MADTVKVSPAQLGNTSQVAGTSSTSTSSLGQDLGGVFTDLTTTLATVPILGSVTSGMEVFGVGLLARLACFATGLTAIDGVLMLAAEAFSYLDVGLANAFANLESHLTYYTGYETNVAMPAINVSAALTTGHYALSTSTLTLNTASASHSSFLGGIGHAFSSAWHSTSNFVSHHGIQALKYGGAAVAIAGLWTAGTILAPETGGASEFGAAAGTSALLSAVG